MSGAKLRAQAKFGAMASWLICALALPAALAQPGMSIQPDEAYGGGQNESAAGNAMAQAPGYSGYNPGPGNFSGYSGAVNYSGNAGYGHGSYGGYASANRAPYYGPNYQPYPRPQTRMAYAPSGLVIPCTLNTSISTQAAGAGDYIQATISQNVALSGLTYIPAGSVIQGSVVDAQAGRRLNRSGKLEITFSQLRLPNGQQVQMSGHVLGDLGKYHDKNGVYHGEGWGAKLEGFAGRTLLGAGSGALFGGAVGAISGGRFGSGLLGGLAIGGGLGAADDLVLRRGRNVLIHSGTPFQLQLDEPMQFPVNWSPQGGPV